MRLLASDQSLLATGVVLADGRNEQIQFQALQDGRLVIEVGAANWSSGTYRLTAVGASGAEQLSLVPWTVRTGTGVQAGAFVAELDPSTPVVARRLDLPAGFQVSASVVSDHDPRDYQLTIVAPDGTTLLDSQDGPVSSNVWNSHSVEQSGIYTVFLRRLSQVKISARVEIVIGAAWEVELHSGTANDSLDAAQSVDQAWVAVPQATGDRVALATLAGSLTEGDQDYYRLSLATGDHLTLGLQTDESATGQLTFWGKDGQPLEVDFQQTNAFDSVSSLVRIDQAGDYVVQVSGAGQYVLTIVRNAVLGTGDLNTVPTLAGINHAVGVTKAVGTVYVSSGFGAESLRVLDFATGTTYPVGFATEFVNQGLSTSHLPDRLFTLTDDGIFLVDLAGTLAEEWDRSSDVGIAYDPTSKRLFRLNGPGGTIDIFDPGSRLSLGQIEVGFIVQAMGFRDGQLYLLSGEDSLLRRYDFETDSLVEIGDTGRFWGEVDLSYDPYLDRFYTFSRKDVYAIDPVTAATQFVTEADVQIAGLVLVPGILDPTGNAATIWQRDTFEFLVDEGEEVEIVVQARLAADSQNSISLEVADRQGDIIASTTSVGDASLQISASEAGPLAVRVSSRGIEAFAYVLELRRAVEAPVQVVALETLGAGNAPEGVRAVFSAPVSLLDGGLSVRDLSGEIIAVPIESIEVNGSEVTWKFGPTSWAAGEYDIRLAAASIMSLTGDALDGDANGIAGGDWTGRRTIAAPGDTDLDGDVDSLDLLTFLAGWTGGLAPGAGDRTFREGDFDADLDVDSVDLLALLSNWTGAVAPPPPALIDERLPEVREPLFHDEDEQLDAVLEQSVLGFEWDEGWDLK